MNKVNEIFNYFILFCLRAVFIGINILSFLVSCHLNIKSILHRENARLIIKLNPKNIHTLDSVHDFFVYFSHTDFSIFPLAIQEQKEAKTFYIFFSATWKLKYKTGGNIFYVLILVSLKYSLPVWCNKGVNNVLWWLPSACTKKIVHERTKNKEIFKNCH